MFYIALELVQLVRVSQPRTISQMIHFYDLSKATVSIQSIEQLYM